MTATARFPLQDVRLPEEAVAEFAVDLLTALAFLHSRGLVYCDVKPSNILLDENGRMKLGDFGLTRRVTGDVKSDGAVAALPPAKRGTPAYMVRGFRVCVYACCFPYCTRFLRGMAVTFIFQDAQSRQP